MGGLMATLFQKQEKARRTFHKTFSTFDDKKTSNCIPEALSLLERWPLALPTKSCKPYLFNHVSFRVITYIYNLLLKFRSKSELLYINLNKNGNMELDNLDKRIISQLDRDARASNSKIARALRINKNVVNYRIKSLEQEGIIRG